MQPASGVTTDERRSALEQIAAEVAACTRCPLFRTRTTAVPGEGNPDTEVVFVGEGPGYNEDQQGRPFVGAAGSLLNDLLRQIGWKRQEVFITNVVKCRPPGNRDPEPDEIAACAPYLQRQLEVLNPAVVVTLGRHSLQTFNPGARIGAVHGTVRPVAPETGAQNALTYAMYHPAAALRQGSLKQTMLEDMCGLPDALIESRKRRGSGPEESVAASERVPEVESVPAMESAPALEPVQVDESEPETMLVEIEPELVPVAVGAELEVVLESTAVPDENQMSLFG